jgi:hypothetical protein
MKSSPMKFLPLKVSGFFAAPRKKVRLISRLTSNGSRINGFAMARKQLPGQERRSGWRGLQIKNL